MDARVREAQSRVRRFVAGERPRGLFQVEPPAPKAGEIPDGLDRPVGVVIREADLQLRRQLWENERRLGFGGDDWAPALHPYLGTGVLASAFGAETAFPDGEQPWTRPFVRSADEALALRRPKATAGLLGEVLERTRRMREAGGRDYPIRMTDIQSPLDTAMLIWEQSDLFLSMLTAPKGVHHVLGLVTELTIELVERQREAAGEAFVPLHWPPTWWPAGEGIGVSDDVLPLVGPREYEAFGVPYLARLSEAFGGIMVHSCGKFTQNLGLVAGLPGLRMVNFGATEQPVGEAARALGREVIVSTHMGLNTAPHFETNAAFVEHVFSSADDARRMWVLAGTDGDDAGARDALVGRLKILASGTGEREAGA